MWNNHKIHKIIQMCVKSFTFNLVSYYAQSWTLVSLILINFLRAFASGFTLFAHCKIFRNRILLAGWSLFWPWDGRTLRGGRVGGSGSGVGGFGGRGSTRQKTSKIDNGIVCCTILVCSLDILMLSCWSLLCSHVDSRYFFVVNCFWILYHNSSPRRSYDATYCSSMNARSLPELPKPTRTLNAAFNPEFCSHKSLQEESKMLRMHHVQHAEVENGCGGPGWPSRCTVQLFILICFCALYLAVAATPSDPSIRPHQGNHGESWESIRNEMHVGSMSLIFGV